MIGPLEDFKKFKNEKENTQKIPFLKSELALLEKIAYFLRQPPIKMIKSHKNLGLHPVPIFHTFQKTINFSKKVSIKVSRTHEITEGVSALVEL